VNDIDIHVLWWSCKLPWYSKCRTWYFCDSLSAFVNFSKDHTREYASKLIHNDFNPFLIKNENVNLFTPISQVIAKIIMHNIVSTPDEFNHARWCTSLLIYYSLSFIPVNLPRLIFDIMTGPNLTSNSLLFGMLLTLLFKQ